MDHQVHKSPLNRGLIEHSEKNFRCSSTHFFTKNSRARIIYKEFILRNPTTCCILEAILRDWKDKPILKIEKIASIDHRVAIILLTEKLCDLSWFEITLSRLLIQLQTTGQFRPAILAMILPSLLDYSERNFSLGLGIPPHMPSWGNMLNEGQRDIARGIWWTTLFPGMMIVIKEKAEKEGWGSPAEK